MSFSKALAFVLEREGGYVNDPDDPGGETKFGISKRSYPAEDITNLTIARATFLYERDYWRPNKCSSFPEPLDMALLDAVVNQPPDITIKQLQAALGVTRDGKIGKQTIGAALQAADDGQLTRVIREFLRLRILRYARLATASKYLGGWVDRVLLLHETCLEAL